MKAQITFILAAFAALIASASAEITIDWVLVGNANNAADTTTYGAVDHVYQMGKYEVTNAQYGAFLNAKGQSNTNGIYHSSMPSYGITQSGSSGSFSYTVDSAWANRPVVNVSWFDAARFSNWMMNGQGSASMETGAYTLNNAISGIIHKNVGASVYLPSENEWYKAAYYKASNASYSIYPNGQNSITTADANYNSILSRTTDVGTYSGDASFYGTFDQGGNVWEFNDAVISGGRGMRGGAYFDGGPALGTGYRSSTDAASEGYYLGFRVASVPEPTSMLLAMFAGGIMLLRRKR